MAIQKSLAVEDWHAIECGHIIWTYDLKYGA